MRVKIIDNNMITSMNRDNTYKQNKNSLSRNNTAPTPPPPLEIIKFMFKNFLYFSFLFTLILRIDFDRLMIHPQGALIDRLFYLQNETVK